MARVESNSRGFERQRDRSHDKSPDPKKDWQHDGGEDGGGDSWPVRCWPTHQCSCSMNQPPAWIRPPSRG